MAAPTVYYMRHGETEWNVLGRLQGTQDIPLNDLGRRQAVHAGGVLRDLLARDDRGIGDLGYVASPLVRARTTMELVRARLDLVPHDYAVDRRLREIEYGSWEGSTLLEAESSDPGLYARRLADKWSVAAPGGESYVEVQRRVSEWYAQLRGDTVAVAHGGTARALMVALGLETPHSAAELYVEQGVVYVFRDGRLEKHR